MSPSRFVPAGMPGIGWWLMLALVLGVSVFANWALGTGLLLLLLVQAARPFDFTAAVLLMVTGGAFVFNEGGGMVRQLGAVTGIVAVMLGCYVLAMGRRTFSLPNVGLALPLLAFLAWTALNTARGMVGGAPAKHVGLELMPLLGLGVALLIANAFDAKRDLRLAFLALTAIAYGVSIWAFIVFTTVSSHTTGFYSMAIPGMAGVMLVNLALRSTSAAHALGWMSLSVPLFVHQFVTFGRGLWTGCIAALVVSFVLFAGFGRNSGGRWKRVGLLMGFLGALAVAGAIQAALVLNQSSLLEEAWTRFTSITKVDSKMETRSNVLRLLEYGRVIGLIQESPLLGHGVGFTFTLKDLYSGKVASQWGVHQNFLMIWLKQGLVGVVLFIWMLGAAIALGLREARPRLDPWESSWFASTAACTTFLVVFSLTNYPFSRVNETFFLAMLWGGSMAMAQRGRMTVRWSEPDRPGSDGVA